MQLLFTRSYEHGLHKGLGIIDGEVKSFPPKLKIPHMGWNQINIKNQCKLLNNIENDSFVYFCHSYYPVPKDSDIVAATCDYGSLFACAVNKGNIYGVQFHPEKSQGVGLKMLENFVKLC
ncbi:MAG: imidazole glycerol phosphate synthase subunit HisH [Candidatus Omnitrophica bacterium]|nr:imidazole glycerol phosphate synthase subunit HisH [Candidatus Omnitrophota bacterium]